MYDDGRPDKPAPAPAAAAPRPAAAPAGLIGEVMRYWLAIVVLAIIGGILAYGASRIMTPRFVSTAQIFVDPRGLQVFDNELTPRQQDSNTAINFVESQARIVTSQSVLSRVIDSERLTEDPEFNGQGGESWAVGLLKSIGMEIGRAHV